MEEKKQAPEKTFKVGGITASVFAHVRGKNDNSAFISKNVQITKTYFDGKEYKTTTSYDVNDLPKLALVANRAYEYIVSEEQR